MRIKINLFIVVVLLLLSFNISSQSCPNIIEAGAPGGSANYKCLRLIWTGTVPAGFDALSITSNLDAGTYEYEEGDGTVDSPALYGSANCKGGINFVSTAATLNIVSVGTCNYNTGGVLPITYMDISVAKNANNNIEIKWVTSSEINNDYFVVEKSNKNIGFREIGILEGGGDTNLESNYNFIDQNPENDIIYYRIAQYDFDGTKSYSDVLKFDNRSDKSDIVYTLFPTRKQIQIESTGNYSRFQITSIDGNVFLNNNITDELTFDLGHLPTGIYILSFIGDQLRSEKIMIP